MTTYGYARVSTQDQHLDGQLSQLTAAGCTVIYQEKASGAKDDRPQLAALMGQMQLGDSIVVCKIDRIARSTQNLLNLIEQMDKAGVAFKALNVAIDTSTPTGRLMLTMLGAIAEFERTLMLERQADGITRAKAAGKYKGRAPTAKARTEEVMMMLDMGLSAQRVADQMGIGVASVYRIKAAGGTK